MRRSEVQKVRSCHDWCGSASDISQSGCLMELWHERVKTTISCNQVDLDRELCRRVWELSSVADAVGIVYLWSSSMLMRSSVSSMRSYSTFNLLSRKSTYNTTPALSRNALLQCKSCCAACQLLMLCIRLPSASLQVQAIA